MTYVMTLVRAAALRRALGVGGIGPVKTALREKSLVGQAVATASVGAAGGFVKKPNGLVFIMACRC